MQDEPPFDIVTPPSHEHEGGRRGLLRQAFALFGMNFSATPLLQ
jgi:hypothetical protein